MTVMTVLSRIHTTSQSCTRNLIQRWKAYEPSSKEPSDLAELFSVIRDAGHCTVITVFTHAHTGSLSSRRTCTVAGRVKPAHAPIADDTAPGSRGQTTRYRSSYMCHSSRLAVHTPFPHVTAYYPG
ncbi:hypothetical protein ISCGN_017100 [Ixodes scapularis]